MPNVVFCEIDAGCTRLFLVPQDLADELPEVDGFVSDGAWHVPGNKMKAFLKIATRLGYWVETFNGNRVCP